jgi:hypothetical protein
VIVQFSNLSSQLCHFAYHVISMFIGVWLLFYAVAFILPHVLLVGYRPNISISRLLFLFVYIFQTEPIFHVDVSRCTQWTPGCSVHRIPSPSFLDDFRTGMADANLRWKQVLSSFRWPNLSAWVVKSNKGRVLAPLVIVISSAFVVYS